MLKENEVNYPENEFKKFLTNPPVPKRKIMICNIVMDNSYFYPKYHLVLKENGKTLISAKKRKFKLNSLYNFSLDPNNLTNPDSNLGSLTANFLGTEFNLYGMRISEPTDNIKVNEVYSKIGRINYVFYK